MGDKTPPVKRNLKPRTPLAIAPAMVSQLTSFAVLGLNDSRYLEWLAKHPEIPRQRVGQLLLSDPRDWQRALAPLDAATPAPVDSFTVEVETVDDVLAVLGKRRTA